MDYTLLTAVHPRRIAPVKMNARQEQEYYEQAAANQTLPEKAAAVMEEVRHWARALLALIQSIRKNFSHGLSARKALH